MSNSGAVAPFPVIHIAIADQTVRVNGRLVDAGEDLDLHRVAVHAVARDVAQELDRPVRAIATADGNTTRLVIHPDGSATDIESITSQDAATDESDAQAASIAALEASLDTVQGEVDASSPFTPPRGVQLVTGHDEAANVVAHVHIAPVSVFPLLNAVPAAPSVRAAETVAPAPVTSDKADVVADVRTTDPALEDDGGRTLNDLLAGRPAPRPGPATIGWRGLAVSLSGGLIRLDPGPAEMAHRVAITSVQRSLDGPKTIVIVNPKGGAYKTTASLLIAATFGIHRGGYTLAWDNNETRGTLGWRANPGRHTNTAVDLLRDLDRFAGNDSARVGDLDNYVRGQGSAQFDVLASDEDATATASIDAAAFDHLHRCLARFYRVIVVDTGNNMRASNWAAAVAAADQLVIISSVKEDTAQSAAWLLDGLRSSSGSRRAVKQAVTVLASTSTSPSHTDLELSARLHDHFSTLTRAVVDVPHDPALHGGGPIDYDTLSPASRAAWLRVTAAIADGL
jgi:putative peptide zinc metalloprotease protein